LVDAETFTMEPPSSVGDYDVEILTDIPEKLGAQKSITVAYRVTRRAATATAKRDTSLYDEVQGYGGGEVECTNLRVDVKFLGSSIICPDSPNSRVAYKRTNFMVTILQACEVVSWGDEDDGDDDDDGSDGEEVGYSPWEVFRLWDEEDPELFYRVLNIPHSVVTQILLGECEECRDGQISNREGCCGTNKICDERECKTVSLTGVVGLANGGQTTVVKVGEPVNFAAYATEVGCYPNPLYFWDFGEGGGMGQFATHTYTQPGEHTVLVAANCECSAAQPMATVTVIVEECQDDGDELGECEECKDGNISSREGCCGTNKVCDEMVCKTVSLPSVAAVASVEGGDLVQFVPGNEINVPILNVPVGEPVTFAAYAPGTDCAEPQYFWDLGDGGAIGWAVIRTYNNPGVYEVLVAANCECSSDQPINTITVIVAEVEILSADVTQDQIQIRLSPADVEGTLTLELTGDNTHTIRQNVTRTGNSEPIIETFDIENLAVGEYTQVRATWTVNNTPIQADFAYRIKVLGDYNHTRYNTPTESYCSGSQTTFNYTQGDCVNVQCSNWNTDNALSGWLSEVGENGSGYSSTLGYVSLEWECTTNEPGMRLRRVNAPCPQCGGALTVGDSVARNPANEDLPCNARVYVHQVGVVIVRDAGNLAMNQLDHYAGTSGCNRTAGTIGLRKTIRLYDN
jgi:hypothetical protein